MPDQKPLDSMASFFLVEVDGEDIGSFLELSGLEVHVNVETYDEGGQNEFVRKLPGRLEWQNVILKRGLVQSDNLLAWLRESGGEGFAAKGNKLARTSAAITLMYADGTRIRSWELAEAFPVRWTGPRLAVSAVTGLTEELEIAHHGLRPRAS